MASRWRDFEMPKRLACDERSLTPTYGKFIAEPFERGYGVTVGNSLRRVLLSSIEGAAATSVKFEGALHEFTTIPGVQEDVTELVLNIKQLVFRLHTRGPKTVILQRDKKGEITGADIQTDDTVEVVNPTLQIGTLTKHTKFTAEIEVSRGRGYVPAEQHKQEGQPIGVVPVDAAFSPVQRVNFTVEDTRVGQITDYDRLILEIWTNGSLNPKDALLYASNILQRHLDVFVTFGTLPEEPEAEPEPIDRELEEKLAMPVSELELSVRSANCLRESKILTIGDLIKKTPPEMLKFRNFGKKSLAEIENILKGMGLSLGMDLGASKKISQVPETASSK